ncbi:hypothetical protein GOP47_0006960 [Adiantum capillus-veneris]|uniref:OVATE domain-containing protein n=1 Tax=Adiantum capillus-veneris TaxID=13818 RepID=A0A9D4V0C2_ADICA|nr:hypothetical protein GOP47_0006960 [Adiantum capillus-veneris]
MGKMRLKLSRVMPHAWFYKLKEVGKPGVSQFKAFDATRKSAYASPINHKAVDIPFPADTPKRSPHLRPPPADDFIALDQLHLLELSDECRPSIVLPYAPIPENIMSLSLEEDNLHRISSAPDANPGLPPNSAVNFDVRELERRLKELDFEDRRKYHSSPVLLSVSVPSPMTDGAPYTSIKVSVGQKGPDGYSLDACGACDVLSGAYERGRKSPLLNVSYAIGERPSEGCVSNGGEGLCGSVDESNRQSTSSSDTGFERGSSSMWERDVFSITSDGSEAFTAVCPDETEPGHKSKQRLWKLRERMNPSPYGSVHMENGMSRFYEDNREVGMAENDMVKRFFRNRSTAGQDVPDTRRQISQARRELQIGESLHPALRVQKSDVGQGKRDGHYRIKMPFSQDDSYQEEGTSFSTSRKQEITMYKSMQSLPNCGEEVDSFSLPDDRNDCLSVQGDSGDGRVSVRSRLSAGRFSYARCKERLLSSQQPRINAATETQEEQTLSNYAKFKLKQRGVEHGKVYENITTTHTDLRSDAARQDQGARHVLMGRQSTSSYHSKSPHIRAKEQIINKSNVQEQGPSRFKGTLRAVREKTRDPSFEQFSPSTSAGGTPLTTSHSRVFDSFAMVKCSYDPRHDFKESMVEMIMEKGLHSSHDMVELLQCYLTLNGDVYHDTIVKVFTEVWSEMFQHV